MVSLQTPDVWFVFLVWSGLGWVGVWGFGRVCLVVWFWFGFVVVAVVFLR